MPISAKNVLFVFAHQDDEVGAIPWIARERSHGNRVACVYLTDGGSRTPSSIRDEESLAALCAYGLGRGDVAFLSDGQRIPDSALRKNVTRASEMLRQWIAAEMPEVDRIYSLAWEGGHPDHDVAHVVALLAAERLGILSDAWAFSLYNACGCPRPLFRVLRPLRHLSADSTERTIRYNAIDSVRFAFFCWRFLSQWRTWVGLFPELAFRRVLLRRETVVRFDVTLIRTRPHAGELLYERMFGISYSEVKSSLKPLLDGLDVETTRIIGRC